MSLSWDGRRILDELDWDEEMVLYVLEGAL
jgi:hypothetical protein